MLLIGIASLLSCKKKNQKTMTKSFLLLSLCFAVGAMQAKAQWAQKQSFPGNSTEELTAFSVGSYGYVLTEDSTGNFWRFDPGANTWSLMASFPGPARTNAVGFTIGSAGYIAAGSKPFSASITYNDLWAYDPATNTWTQKASMPGPGKVSASGFAIGSKGYVAGGWSSDLYEYDATTNTWAQKASVPFGPVNSSVAFAIGGKGYMGTGDNGGTGPLAEFWEYNPGTNAWTRKADFGGGDRIYATGFALNGKGYIGTGYSSFGAEDDDLWEYDPSTNTWTRKPDMGADGRFDAVSMAIAGKGYLGLGQKASGSGGGTADLNDFWAFTPSTVGISDARSFNSVKIFPNPSAGTVYFSNLQKGTKIKIQDVLGKTLFTLSDAASPETVPVNLNKGIYLAEITENEKVWIKKLIIE
jgi:N-acetylneuraminic acid mutarotase